MGAVWPQARVSMGPSPCADAGLHWHGGTRNFRGGGSPTALMEGTTHRAFASLNQRWFVRMANKVFGRGETVLRPVRGICGFILIFLVISCGSSVSSLAISPLTATVDAGTWGSFDLPLSAFGLPGAPGGLNRLGLLEFFTTAPGTFYVDTAYFRQ